MMNAHDEQRQAPGDFGLARGRTAALYSKDS